MNQNKVYLVRALSRIPYEDYSFILDGFTSKELAEKVANGFNDVVDNLIEDGESFIYSVEEIDLIN